mgnify:CR=1 FL=1
MLDVKKYELELFGEERSDGSILYGALEKSTGGILLIDEVSDNGSWDSSYTAALDAAITSTLCFTHELRTFFVPEIFTKLLYCGSFIECKTSICAAR